ncbi:urease subunit gamma/beta [Amycolatopsis xylanica]|uniref:urease n=1 Tax=Amycolatopsis xylanica TaxID=589385 RepID=A0A1H3CTT8_9PSEU|nr:urease subunit gamma [Amycolatopsis xylanica]SDX57652.1 urease subunit gamma/beta [Amycolatopsis xylanica]
MRLTPTEQDRLLLFTAAELARARLGRGLRLNVPEATALIADAVCEAARDGKRLADAVAAGRAVLRPEQVLPGVADIVTEIQVEAVFEDGSRLAVVTDPLAGGGSGDDAPGAFLPTAALVEADPDVITLTVTNSADVPISVTSHFHFFEVNRRLWFDRRAAYGRRAAIPAGDTIRFDPGGSRSVDLIPIGGDRIAIGFAGLVDGPLDDPRVRAEAMRTAERLGYLEGPA